MKKLDNKTIEQILYYRLIMDKSEAEVAELLDIGKATVSTIVRIYKAIKTDDWAIIVRVAELGSSSIDAVRGIAEGQGKEVPGYVTEAFLNRNARQNIARAERNGKEVKADEAKAEPQDNSGLYMVKLLEAIHAQNELIAQLCDVVIPHWCADLKDNFNANADSIGQRLDRVVSLVDGINCNTRKRGM